MLSLYVGLSGWQHCWEHLFLTWDAHSLLLSGACLLGLWGLEYGACGRSLRCQGLQWLWSSPQRTLVMLDHLGGVDFSITLILGPLTSGRWADKRVHEFWTEALRSSLCSTLPPGLVQSTVRGPGSGCHCLFCLGPQMTSRSQRMKLNWNPSPAKPRQATAHPQTHEWERNACFVRHWKTVFYALLLQPNLKHLHKEKYPTRCQEHPPLAALKTLDTVNEQEIDLIPDDTEVWIHTFKYNHINNYTIAHCDND